MFVVLGGLLFLSAGRLDWGEAREFLGVYFLLSLAASLVNTFMSSRVRIQEERGHQAVTTGSYAFGRHPMYVGVSLYGMCLPVLLGSWRGLAVGGLMIVLVVIHTSLEDKTLRAELAGYAEYARRVPYRLLPGVW